MKTLRDMLTSLFTKTNLEPALVPVREAAVRDADLLCDTYEDAFYGRVRERFTGAVSEFTGSAVLAIEAPRGREYYQSLDYTELRELVKERELQPAGRSAEDLVDALVDAEADR